MPFHVFHINEVYSNADGTLQFIELVGDSNGQNFWAGHELVSSKPGQDSKEHEITENLPSPSTSGKAVLFATEGFAAATGVTPDYIIDDNFLFLEDGTLTFPGLFPDPNLSWDILPTSGTHSLNRSGSVVTYSPTNFAGDSLMFGTSVGNNMSGGAGKDNMSGRDGNDTMDGGVGNDTLDGGNGKDRLIGSDGTDRLIGGANIDNLNGGIGTDTLVWDLSDSKVDGGAGASDTLLVLTGNLNIPALPNGKLLGIERINMTGDTDNILTVNKREVLDLSAQSNTLTVLGDDGDTVDLVGAWVLHAPVVGFVVYKLDTAIIKIDTEITIV